MGVLIGLFFTMWSAATYFAYTRPQFPERAIGRIFPIRVHGTIVYLTRCEYLLAGPPMFWTVLGLFLAVGVMLAILGNPFSRSG